MVEQHDPLYVPTSSLLTTPLFSTDDLAQEDLLQKYKDRVDKLSQQNRVTKFCTDAGFLTTVDVGQYFMTKDIKEFPQFTESVVCREFQRFWLPASRATFPHLPDSRPTTGEEGNDIHGWAACTDGGTHSAGEL